MKQEQEIFEQAMALPSREARDAYLLGACGQNRDLRRSVDELLAAFHDAGEIDFLRGGDRSPEGQTVVADAQLDEGPGTVIGRYKLLQQIGEGGMGVVHMAEQEEPVRRRVALKIIKLGMDTKSVVARFEAERQALAMMDHPNIAKVLDGGATDTGRPYFVMELVRGIKITEYCDEAQLSTRERLDLFIQVCQAIQHAHQKGIIHRDIKPSNILVTLNDGVAVPKVIDFGIAKATEGRLTDKTLFTQFEALIGTPAYMSPEQAVMTSLDIDTRSDIYSLGVLLYELLAGSTPFDARELVASGIDAMRQTIREKEPVRPSTRFATLQGEELTTTAKRRSSETSKLLHQLKGDLDWIVMKCLEKDRVRRYETANGIVADLQRHLNNEPVVARSPTAAYRFQKAFRRNKLAFAAVASVAAVLVLGVVVSTGQAIRARRAEREQRRQLYVSDMIVAEKALREGNLRRADELLKNYLPQTGAREELRGFEYYYLLKQCQGEQLFTFPAEENAVFSVAYSSDGKTLATAGCYREPRDFSGHLKLFDLSTRREITTLALPSPDGIRSVAFSPDGKLLACGTAGSVVGLWDASTYRLLDSFYAEQAAAVTVAFSPNGKFLAATLFATSRGGVPGRIKVWDAQTRQLVHDFKTRIPRPEALAFSPDGKWLAYVDLLPEERQGFDGLYFQVWRGNSQYESVNVNTLHLWDLETQRDTTNRVSFGGGVSSLQFSPDSKTLAFGASSGLVALWNVERQQSIEVGRHEDAVLSVTFSGDGRLASSSADGTIKIWDLPGRKEARVLRGDRDQVKQVVFSPDGTQLASASFDRTVRLWSVASTEGDLLRGHVKAVTAVDFHPDGQLLATASWDHTVRIWDILSRKVRHSFTNLTNAVLSLAFSPDGRYLATGDAARNISVWQTASWNLMTNLTAYSESNNVSGLSFSSDAKLLFVAEYGFVSVWEVESWRRVATLVGASQRPAVVAASSDGALLGVGSESIQLYEVGSWRRRKWLSPGAIVGAMSFTPDSRILVTGSSDSKVRLWDNTSENEQPEESLSGQVGGVSALAISPDGKTLAVSDARGPIKLWNLATRKELFTLVAYETSVLSLAFSRDGRILASGCSDGSVRLWRGTSSEAAHPNAPVRQKGKSVP